MASEPVLSRDVGNRTSRLLNPVMVTSDILAMCVYVSLREGLEGQNEVSW